jgi:5-methylcytosine-specific restriction endonuclease McrA
MNPAPGAACGFIANQSAHEVHAALKASLQALENAQQVAVLWFGEILDRQLHRELGYSSINQYARIELGFSTSRTGDFLQLCRKLKALPQVKAKVASGALGYTAARVLVKVTDENNQDGWLDFALNNSRRDLEREVKRAQLDAAAAAAGQPALIPDPPTRRPAAVVPVRVSLEMSPTQFARYEALWEQVRKRSEAPADRVEAMLAMMAAFVDASSPRGELSGPSQPPVQIHVHQCEDCRKATVQTGRGEMEISAAELERVRCDCLTSRPGERHASAVPPATRRQVLAKHRHRCQRPGCGHTQFLEVHHRVPRAQGGGNDPENLVCLCAACHRLLHDGNLKGSSELLREPTAQYRCRSPRCPAPR